MEDKFVQDPDYEELATILQNLKKTLPGDFGGNDEEKAKTGFAVYGLIEDTLKGIGD